MNDSQFNGNKNEKAIWMCEMMPSVWDKLFEIEFDVRTGNFNLYISFVSNIQIIKRDHSLYVIYKLFTNKWMDH